MCIADENSGRGAVQVSGVLATHIYLSKLSSIAAAGRCAVTLTMQGARDACTAILPLCLGVYVEKQRERRSRHRFVKPPPPGGHPHEVSEDISRILKGFYVDTIKGDHHKKDQILIVKTG